MLLYMEPIDTLFFRDNFLRQKLENFFIMVFFLNGKC